MPLYSLLLSLFAIGAVATYKVCRKSGDVSENGKCWLKFGVYFGLVFAQLLAISQEVYLWFASIVVVIGFWELASVGKSVKIKSVALVLFAVFAFGYVLFFDTASVKMQQFLFISVVIFDGYSQLFGQLLGRTKLFPKVSPNKTLEGMAGGFAALVASAFVMGGLLQMAWTDAIANALTIGLFCIAGDFLASYYKRINGVKDYSRAIPGHGGVLDRFDSLIFAAGAWLLVDSLTNGNSEIRACIAYVLVFLALFLLAEIGFRSLQLKAEITRKFVHVCSGLACLTFPFFLKSWISVLVLCAGFVLLLIASKKLGKLPSVNAISRKSHGSALFPVSVFLCFRFFEMSGSYLDFYLPIAILAVCDPLAALAGKKWPFGPYKVGARGKTLVGSAAFFASCFAILALSLYFSEGDFSLEIFVYCCLLSIATTVVEAFSKNGFDNLLIPCCVIALLQVAYFTSKVVTS